MRVFASAQGWTVTTGEAIDFDVFYATNFANSVRLAHLLLGSGTWSHDVAQEAMVLVHRKLDTLDNPGGFLRATIVNLCRNRARRVLRELRFVGTKRPTFSTTIPEVDEIWGEIVKLPARQRMVVVLRFYADWSVDEIAQQLDLPAGTVKSTLHRALARLREGIS